MSHSEEHPEVVEGCSECAHTPRPSPFAGQSIEDILSRARLVTSDYSDTDVAVSLGRLKRDHAENSAKPQALKVVMDEGIGEMPWWRVIHVPTGVDLLGLPVPFDYIATGIRDSLLDAGDWTAPVESWTAKMKLTLDTERDVLREQVGDVPPVVPDSPEGL